MKNTAKKVLVFLGFTTAFVAFQNFDAPTPTPPQRTYITELNQNTLALNWKYKLHFGPAQVPLPQSARIDSTAHVKAVYSPSVIKLGPQNFVMFYGVSIYCRNDTVARDSIAYARSQDGVTWTDHKYIIEPDAQSCAKGIAEWPVGMTFQANDPTVTLSRVNDDIYVWYSAVQKSEHLVDGIYMCSNIGIAIFDKNFNQKFRNDDYLVPPRAYCRSKERPLTDGKRNKYGTGFSRPSLVWNGPRSSELWFDNGYAPVKVLRTKVTNINKLNPALNEIEDMGIAGLDVEIPSLANFSNNMLLADGPFISVNIRDSQGVWTRLKKIFSKTGQSWDRDGQGSPNFFVDPDNCRFRMYFAGVELYEVSPGVRDYVALSIGSAKPPIGYRLGPPLCRPQSAITDSPEFE